MEMPVIQTSFSISASGGELDLEEVSRRLGVSPTRTRRKADFPPQAPAQTSWSLEVKEENAFSVGTVLDKLIRRLAGDYPLEAAKKIVRLCEEFDAEASLEIVIHMRNGDSPEVRLFSAQLLFAAAIGAEIGFDLYCYE